MRLLMIPLLVFAGIASLAFPAKLKPAQVRELVASLGGSIHQSSNADVGWDIGFQVRGRDLDDQGLAKLSGVQGILVLNLRDTQVTDAGMEALGKLADLRFLHLERTAVTDAGMPHLAKLRHLEYLNLYGTEVSDKSVAHLAKLQNLRKLYIWQTKITGKGTAQLKESIPGIEIIGGVDMASLPKSPEPLVEKKVEPKVDLKWKKVGDLLSVPMSYPGTNTKIIFENKSGKKVEIHWVDYGGKLVKYGDLEPGKKRIQNTYSKNSWLIMTPEREPLGYFIVPVEVSRAIIPQF